MTSRTHFAIVLIALLGAAPACRAAATRTSRSASARAKAKVDAFDLDKELAGPKFVFEMAGRRDPFTIPLTVDPALADASNKGARGKLKDPNDIAAEKTRLEQAALDLQKADTALKNGDKAEAVALIEKVRPVLLAEDASSEFVDRYQKLKRTAEQIEKETFAFRVQQVEKGLADKLGDARNLFESGQYDDVIKLGKALPKGLDKDMLEAPPVREKLDVAADLARRAGIRKEFTDHEVVIQGIAMGEKGCVAGINGINVAVGEGVPARLGKAGVKGRGKLPLPADTPTIDGARIDAIDRNAIVIDYKGEKIRLATE